MKYAKKIWAAGLLSASILAMPFMAEHTEAATVNVLQYGAKANDNAVDTTAIQKAIDAAASAGGGIVDIPAGTFDVAVNSSGNGLMLKSNVHLRMDSGTILKLKANSLQNYRLINVSNVQNVKITGGTLIGDRASHTGSGGEWGHGVHIMGSASSIYVYGVTAKNFWGDGFTVENNFETVKKVPNDVVIDRVTADHNRRQGLSIVAGRNITVTNSLFKNTNGTLPASGVDLERDPPYNLPLEGVAIRHNIMENNAGYGLMFAYADGSRAEYNIIRNNKMGGVLLGHSHGNTVAGNTIANNGGDVSESYYSNGVLINYGQNNAVHNNIISGSVKRGVYALNGVNGNKITANKLTSNQSVGIETYGGTAMTITTNHLSSNNGTTRISNAAASTVSNNGSSVAFTAPAQTPGPIAASTAPAGGASEQRKASAVETASTRLELKAALAETDLSPTVKRAILLYRFSK